MSINNKASCRKYYESHKTEILAKAAEYRKAHPEKRREWNRAYHERNKDAVNAKQRAYWRKLRRLAIERYGGKCACCGINTDEFLSIDHTNGGGNQHRKEMKINGSKIYMWLRDNDYPEGFRVLCHNCNLSRGFYGYCPHENK